MKPDWNIDRKSAKRTDRNIWAGQQSAQITVFVSMALVVILALLCTTLESARVSVLRYYIRTAAESSVFSAFSEYHRELLDRYHLFFLKDDGSPEQSVMEYLSFYEDPSKGLMVQGAHFYPFHTESVRIREPVYAMDQEGMPFETEILEYMKYGMMESLMDQVKDKLNMGSQCQEMMGAVDQITDAAGELFDLENQYGQLRDTVEALKITADEAAAGLQEMKPLLREKTKLEEEAAILEDLIDGADALTVAAIQPELDHVMEELADVWDRLDKAAGQVEQKEKNVERLAEKSGNCLEQIRIFTERLDARMEQPLSQLEQLKPQLSGSFLQAANQQTEVVAAYTEDSGKRKAMAIQVGSGVNELQGWMDRFAGIEEILGEELETAEAALDERSACLSQKTEFVGTEELQPAQEAVQSDFLEQVKALKDKGILALVTDSGNPLSSRQVDENSLPSGQSGTFSGDGEGRETSDIQSLLSGLAEDLYENLCLSEYAVKTMPSYVDVGKMLEGGGGESQFYDLEYILGDSGSDQENLAGAMEKLLLLREGMNFIYLLSDQQKSEEAQLLAMAVSGVFGLTPLAGLVKLMILAAWAFAESVLDVRMLARGGKVPFLKSGDDWKTSLEQAPAMVMGGLAEAETNQKISGEFDGDGEKGMGYHDYLRLLLCLTSRQKKVYRCMDMVQWNIRRNEPDFYLKDCLYEASFWISVQADKLFVTLPLMGTWAGADGTYRFEAVERRSYGEEFSDTVLPKDGADN